MLAIHKTPTAIEKIAKVGTANAMESAGDLPYNEAHPNPDSRVKDVLPCIGTVSTPKGDIPMLKTMLTTACERNCNYCVFRAGRGKTERVTIQPHEMAATVDTLARAGKIQGLFLSSGIIRGGVTTQDKIIDTAEILRRKYTYRGFIHLKIMPGAEYDQVYRAMQLADRVSINLEAPTAARLDALAPKKKFDEELLQRLIWMERIRQQGVRASSVTQFVVGAVGDTDVELLSLTERLYRQAGLARAYYSAFGPVMHTPFENLSRTLPVRELRLYQASFLLRDYGWSGEDFLFAQQGNLPTDVDPKRAWADAHLRHAPIDLMTAERADLLRVPGIGPVVAEALLKARQQTRLRDFSQLRGLGMRAPEQAAPYILLAGRRPPEQLSLFPSSS